MPVRGLGQKEVDFGGSRRPAATTSQIRSTVVGGRR